MRVLAAMSGGVDSAVAAARAAEQGHDVTGIHLALSRNPKSYRTGARGCCTIEDANDARRAADVIGIPFYVWDLSERFHEDVVEDFLSEYAEGRTPNPCLRCNEKIKFAAVLDRAIALGFDAVVTGHYAQLRRDDDGLIEMHRAEDMGKDQSYVLGVLTQEQLAHSMFPLGDTPKSVDPRGGGAARARRRRQARQPRHLLHQRRRHRRLALREAASTTPGQPRRARSSPPTARCSARTRGRGATRSASARAAHRDAGGRREAALRARHRAGLGHRHRRARATSWPSTASPRSGRAGAARRRRRRSSARSSCARTATSTAPWSRVDGDGVDRRPARPGRGDRPRPGRRGVRRLAGRRLGDHLRHPSRRPHADRVTARPPASGRCPARTSARPRGWCSASCPTCRTCPSSRRRGAIAGHDRSHARGHRRARLRPPAGRLAAHRRARRRPPPGALAAGAGPRHLRGADPGLRGPAQGPAHRPVDAGEHGREAARRPGALRLRRAPRARPGAGRGSCASTWPTCSAGCPGAALLLQLDEPVAARCDGRAGADGLRLQPAPLGDATARLRGARVGVRRGRRDRRPSRTAAPPSRRSGCCAARVPGECRSTSASSRPGAYDELATALDEGARVLLGVVPSTGEAAPATRSVVERVLRLLDMLGFDPAEVADQLVLTPACGLAGATPSYARAALRAVQEAAAELG